MFSAYQMEVFSVDLPSDVSDSTRGNLIHEVTPSHARGRELPDSLATLLPEFVTNVLMTCLKNKYKLEFLNDGCNVYSKSVSPLFPCFVHLPKKGNLKKKYLETAFSSSTIAKMCQLRAAVRVLKAKQSHEVTRSCADNVNSRALRASSFLFVPAGIR
ncbi:hypothetical protein RRG08_004378 [Elysia crispata]|uniref:Uncharacterized protein n=1 Tax=Elysia crispata TaxID=231223 RepID=A0AAE0Z6Y6_9GAST|nr:hypothetical protein RRG08_004378 [Elysia crispata]